MVGSLFSAGLDSSKPQTPTDKLHGMVHMLYICNWPRDEYQLVRAFFRFKTAYPGTHRVDRALYVQT